VCVCVYIDIDIDIKITIYIYISMCICVCVCVGIEILDICMQVYVHSGLTRVARLNRNDLLLYREAVHNIYIIIDVGLSIYICGVGLVSLSIGVNTPRVKGALQLLSNRSK